MKAMKGTKRSGRHKTGRTGWLAPIDLRLFSPRPPSHAQASPAAVLSRRDRAEDAGRQFESVGLQPCREAWSRPGRSQLGDHFAVGCLSLDLEQEDVLQHDDIAFHALNLGDVRDLALAIVEASLLDDQVDRRGDLLADVLDRHSHTEHDSLSLHTAHP